MKMIKPMIGVVLATTILAGCEQSDLKTMPGGNVGAMAVEEVVSGWAEPNDIISHGDRGVSYDGLYFGGFVDEDRISLVMYKGDGYVPFYYKADVGRKILIPSENLVVEILEMKPDEDSIKVKVSKLKEGE